MKGAYRFLLSMVVLVCVVSSAAAEAVVVTGKVDTVTLYRGQALVQRSVPVDAPAGLVEVVVTDLPMHVVAESFFAEADAGIEVRAVRYRMRAVGEEPREAVRKLDAEIERVEDLIAANRKMQELGAKREAYLDKLETFVAPTMTVELSKGVLNAEQVSKLSEFSFENRRKNAEESLRLAKEERDLKRDLSTLQRQRATLTAGTSRTIHEALVFIQKRLPAPGVVKLSYLVGNAGWSPAYNFRAAADLASVDIEYNAIIRQQSGEDWSDVTLTLSTATPALAAQGPGLAPFRVSLVRGAEQQTAQAAVLDQYKSSQMRLNDARVQMQNRARFKENLDFNWAMNSAGNEGQMLELRADRDALNVLRTEGAFDAEGPSISYTLPGMSSIASRSDQQMVRIASPKLAVRFYYVATPLLTSYVYREAEMKNTGPEAMLGGPVSVYLGGRFVGRGEIPTVASGQTFAVGFGADSQVRAARELVDKSERVQGGNREISLQYRLVLENYKNTPVRVLLLERLPIAESDADIRVTLNEGKDKLSADAVYLRVERPKGILRWDVDVPAGASGEKARMLEYDYKLAFDRSMQIQLPSRAQAAQMQDEFNKMQYYRFQAK